MSRVRDLFFRGLGAIFFVAFASLLVQVRPLVGERGLLPACRSLARTSWLEAPSLLRLACPSQLPSTATWLGLDALLVAASGVGLAISLGLTLLWRPRVCLAALWLIYLSFVHAGQVFFSFQWDNLLLETAAFSVLAASPRGTEPHPCAVFLLRWLVVRLQLESGLAKWLGGDPQWRDLTALAAYYETAPLPTWVGWWAHQLPVVVHRASALGTYVVECAVAPFALGPRRVRPLAGLAIVAMQVPILLTANYGFFNWLSIWLCLWCLDDGQLNSLTRWVLRRSSPGHRPASVDSRRASPFSIAATAILVVSTVVPFAPFLGVDGWSPLVDATQRVLAPWRTVNAYHLFVHMTRVRNEIVIEGSRDGIDWIPYEFRWKPGALERAPAFVAPHQPRMDFQAWFLLLGGGGRAEPWRDALLYKLLASPADVAPIFGDNPFGDTPPRWVRVAAYRYRFTDLATRRATGAWWRREPLGVSRRLEAGDFTTTTDEGR